MLNIVILAGGSGTRLWPSSRSGHPKQFLNLHDSNTMLQNTFLRVKNININESIVICNNDHRFFVAEQIKELDIKADIILEPSGKNTAPAIAIAAMSLPKDSLMLVLSADHLIKNQDAFHKSVSIAIDHAQKDKLVNFGVTTTSANTGYGYIKCGKEIDDAYHIEKFVEKPDQHNAKKFHESEDYFWNSGMFMFKNSIFLNELKKYRSDILEACRFAYEGIEKDLDFKRIKSEDFEDCPSESVDYAVMEKTKEAICVPLNAGWSDIGSWSSYWETFDKDENGNVFNADVIAKDVKNTLIKGDDRLIAAIGIEDTIIVETKDALLISKNDKVDKVKDIVFKLKEENRNEHVFQRKVYRPWGSFDSLAMDNKYQVKIIEVNPGAQLSLQSHKFRAEHWVVVEGEATVTKDESSLTVLENESVYIPLGCKHSLSNNTKDPLKIIEVQTGTYFGEDDIVRYKDIYNRSEDE
tara:strand:- start:7150 stop:8550 length:1401 start_codon:yes stop_codon:yes gene_type:complete